MGQCVKLVKNCEELSNLRLTRDWPASEATRKRPHKEHTVEAKEFQCLMASRKWLATWPTCDPTHEMHYEPVCVLFFICFIDTI